MGWGDEPILVAHKGENGGEQRRSQAAKPYRKDDRGKNGEIRNVLAEDGIEGPANGEKCGGYHDAKGVAADPAAEPTLRQPAAHGHILHGIARRPEFSVGTERTAE